MPIRIASFNVENLFARPKVFNFRDKSVGDTILKRIDDFQNILKKREYTAANKNKLLKEFTEGTSRTESAPLKDFIVIREDRGKLWKRNRQKIIGIKAGGIGDWDGSIDFKKAKFSEIGRKNTGKVVRAVNADIACIVEADNRPSLKKFDTDVLRSKYRYEMLLDGNDQRGIDVGLYSRFPLGGIWTHMFDGSQRSKTFSRDCPEYEVILPNSDRIFVLCNHLKSKGYGDAAANNRRRKGQAEAIRNILKGYDLRNDMVVVAGDLNDTPNSAPLKPVMDMRYLYDVLEIKFPKNPKHRWTYHYRDFEQIDYLLVSRPLRDRLTDAGVYRKGMYRLHALTSKDDDVITERELSSVTHWTNGASDHAAVWADFEI
ncbi:MAG: endonuclease/exonuclease/phosphatase family protein [Pseudomonadota bacterium]